MKPGDIITIFVDPVTMESPEGQARLIKLTGRAGNLESWTVEFLDQEGKYYTRLIKP